MNNNLINKTANLEILGQNHFLASRSFVLPQETILWSLQFITKVIISQMERSP